MRYNTRNPILTKDLSEGYAFESTERASFSGVAVKSGALILLIFAIAGGLWYNLDYNFATIEPYIFPLFIGSWIIGFISVLVASFSYRMAPLFTVIYAVAQGVFLGLFSYIVNMGYPTADIIPTAIMITFAIFGFLLFTYATGIFKVGFAFRKFVYAATFGVFIFMMIAMIGNAFGANLTGGFTPQILLIIYGGMILLASFHLLIDFDNAKKAVEYGAPKRAEWMLSLGLLVTLVWLYITIVRFLIILLGRRK
ncbi:Bax inhibitor-1/YccA family protein [Haloplasma contractile]|uniref:Conserved transmembrane protein n=1 Tax=Haloplasma contractile SSD-17B TaxID=1033810 RepID=F7PVH1_9MOLU|nr:Bax inhibitor-1/YccA family protein [Haloplasma contractile]ERJ12861.1 Conserved transmembrane protein [Haloplasma contractile SSD-17B]